jgi:hypothetical protein
MNHPLLISPLTALSRTFRLMDTCGSLTTMGSGSLSLDVAGFGFQELLARWFHGARLYHSGIRLLLLFHNPRGLDRKLPWDRVRFWWCVMARPDCKSRSCRPLCRARTSIRRGPRALEPELSRYPAARFQTVHLLWVSRSAALPLRPAALSRTAQTSRIGEHSAAHPKFHRRWTLHCRAIFCN